MYLLSSTQYSIGPDILLVIITDYDIKVLLFPKRILNLLFYISLILCENICTVPIVNSEICHKFLLPNVSGGL